MPLKKLNQKSIGAGVVAGAVTPFVARVLPAQFAGGVANIAVGAYMKNDALQTMGGFAIGQQLVAGGAGADQPGGFL